MNKEHYNHVRFRLTALYFAIIMAVAFVLSLVLVLQQVEQFERIDTLRNQAVNDPFYVPPGTLSRIEQIEQTAQENLRNTFIYIVFCDMAIAFFGAVTSYYLSGKTLSPILQSIELQKRFFADASHELKTPLTAIKTEAEVLLRSPKQVTSRYRAFAQSSLEEINHLDALSTSLLDLARLDSGTRQIRISKIKLEEAVNKCLVSLKPLIASKKIKLNNKVDNFEFSTDPALFGQLLCIIIDNAVKYNKDSGEITLSTEKTDHHLLLKIADTGIGIPKDKLDFIFDRFYRVSDDRSQKGFGLGLAIAKEVADNLKIGLSVSSELGKGSTFSLNIPLDNQK